MTALRLFMLDLLKDRSDEGVLTAEIVVDNAALKMERLPSSCRTNLPPLAIANTSNHSSNRWETDGPSPAWPSEQSPQGSTRAFAVLHLHQHQHQRRSPMQAHKNTSPACPIRKLSPRVHPDDNGDKSSVPTMLRLEGKMLLKNFDRLAVVSRPPLSPHKNGGRVFLPGGNRASLSAKKAANVARNKDVKGLQPPVRILSNLPPSKPVVLSVAVPSGEEQGSGFSDKATNVPTRGLSQTLLGIDFTEQAPVCPTRRPSTQSSDLDTTGQSGSLGKNKPSENQPDSEKEIYVLPPTPENQPNDDVSTMDSPSLPAAGGCSPILLQRLTKRR